MSDEPTNQLDEEVVLDEQPQPSEAPLEEQVEVQEDTEAEVTEEVNEEPQERPPSRREQLRVQALLKKYGPPQPRPAPSQDVPNFRDKIEAEEDTYKTIEDTAKSYGEAQFNAGLSRAEFNTWRRFLQLDENNLRAKYPELNPSNSETYNELAEQTLQQKYLQFVGYNPGDPQNGIAPSVNNPDISYLEFVEAELEFANELASQKVQRTTKNLTKQAASTGLRPDGTSPKPMNLNKDPSEMTNEELNAAISRTMPRDAKGRFTTR